MRSSRSNILNHGFSMYNSWKDIGYDDILNLAGKLFLPILKILIVVCVMITISIVVTYISYISMLPKALLKEPIYFDYSLKNPVARVNLLSLEKQWDYVKHDSTQYENFDKISSYPKKRFLKINSYYSIDVDFALAKSSRNYDIGKFMLYTSIIDSNGDSIAKSIRPVVVPYQSIVTNFLYLITTFPLKLFHLLPQAENSIITVPVMNQFKEPPGNAPGTEYIELSLSLATPDIYESTLTVMPVLKGLTYYVYYYPNLFIITSSIILTLIQISMVLSFLILSWTYTYIFGTAIDSSEVVYDSTESENNSFGDASSSGVTHSETASPVHTMIYDRNLVEDDDSVIDDNNSDLSNETNTLSQEISSPFETGGLRNRRK